MVNDKQGRQEARLHHVVGEREESGDGGGAEKDRGELKRERWTMTSHLLASIAAGAAEFVIVESRVVS